MRQPLVLANWKMNGSLEFSRTLISDINQGWQGDHRAEVAVCPPAVYLSQVAQLVSDSSIALGAQDVSAADSGAYTGESAASMLQELGCRYVIVGHSERREYHGESSEYVAEKVAAAQSKGLIPVLCVGESLEERDSGSALHVIGEQLQAVISLVGQAAMSSTVIAYEPVWAIGTGRTATPEQAQAVHAYIRSQLEDDGVRILYGGSVKPDNAKELFGQPDIDGALVGGASLKSEDFLAICAAAD